MKILVTGAAGFIGMHLCERLCSEGHQVFGVDNLNDYYEVELKQARLARLRQLPGFEFEQLDIADGGRFLAWAQARKPQRVVNLAAQVGVRYSLVNPGAYTQSNLAGFTHVLELCRSLAVEHLVYASSSSVYGGNQQLPFSEQHSVDHPVSLYAATKKANELMAHAYSHLYGIPTTGLRFFTVYGPWGRPDMATWLFTEAIANGQPIRLFNHGNMMRDFTYVGDIVESLVRVLYKPATPDPHFDRRHPSPDASFAPFRVFNIGNASPVALLDFVQAIEQALGKQAVRDLLPMQAGDVMSTEADTRALDEWIGFVPATPIREGVQRFVDWYLPYRQQHPLPLRA
ncbi:MAG: NAD-dependent epimerase [Betaproteobacteria bacterium]|nr:NAD-dependent epimerase [Betaproteobacteria bacterium]